MSRKTMPAHAAFTVIELLVVIAIIAVSAGLTMPAVQKSREAAERTATMNNLSQCAKAVHLCHDQFKKYPPYYGVYGAKTTAFSFHTHLLPFLDQAKLYKQEKPDPKAVVPAFLSPMDTTQSDKGAGAANYPVNLRLFYTNGGVGKLSTQDNLIYPKMPGTFSDGVSQTLLYANKYMNCGKNGGSMWADTNAPTSPTAATFGASMKLWQSAPKKEDCNPTEGTAVSFTRPAILVAMCDASVRSVATGLSATTWQAVHTPGASDSPGADWIE